MTSIFNFDEQFREAGDRLQAIQSQAKEISKSQQQDCEEIEKLKSELLNLANKAGISLENTLDTSTKKTCDLAKFAWDEQLFLTKNPLVAEARIQEEVFINPELLPSLSSLDYGIVGISGLVASILDFLVVKIPKNINYLGKYQQEGSNFTEWLRTLGIDGNGNLNPFLKWCEYTCKVSYDQSINPDIKGFNPKTHRLLSLSHDPLFGIIFGTLDILNGSMTAFDTNGNIQILKTFDMPLENKVFAPFIWLGHIVSDMCTKMGVPIPGWAFLQLIQFGSFGSNNKTIADVSRWMYTNGYDLRHFVTMSVSVAVIEIIIRGYHYLSSIESAEQMQYSMHTSIASREITQIKSNLKLHKMLFLAYSVAASGNALKVFTYSGNPLAINLPQWLLFLKESVKMVQAATRNKTSEKIVRNRDKINQEWEEIKNIRINQFDMLKADSTIYFDYFKS